MKSSQATARVHLRLLAQEVAKVERQEQRYVTLASRYGVGPREIAELTGVPLLRVLQLIAQNAQPTRE